jgi:hypothetical protein
MRILQRSDFRLLGTLAILMGLCVSGASGQPFNCDTGNAPIEVVIPSVLPALFGFVSPTANDATLVLRLTTLITNGWFDAAAPYHPTAVGVYSRLGRRPPTESATNCNINIAAIYASYRVLNSMLPNFTSNWRDMVSSVGLDPDDDQVNMVTPSGIGNAAGFAVVAAREHDGMNQLGDEGGHIYNRQPYADYLGYKPVNTPYELKDPSRWQPQIITMGNGIFRVQQFVTPQLRVTTPYSYQDHNQFNSPRPMLSNPRGPHGRQGYIQQADEVLAASAALTDEQKLKAETFDNKIASLGLSAVFAAQSQGLSVQEFIQLDFLTNLAAFDTAIAIWNEKHQWDAVRPFSAIRYIYGDRPVTAWGGPGMGTVNDLPASQWRSYLNTADHPEYPSASASFCAAHAQASRRFLGTDALGYMIPVPQGSSIVEPGVTPAADIILSWATWTDFEMECGMSRFWGGVHFLSSVKAGQDIGKEIGDLAYRFVQDHIAGSAAAP